MKKIILPIIGIVLLQACATMSSFQGDLSFNETKYNTALQQYLKAYKLSPKSKTALKIAECYTRKNDLKLAGRWFNRINFDEKTDPKYILTYANILRTNGDHDEAKEWYQKYLAIKPNDEKAKAQLLSCDMLDVFQADSFYYQVSKLNLHLDGSDFSPVVYKDGIVFTSNRTNNSKTDEWTGNSFLKLYFSKLSEDGSLESPELFSGSLSSNWHDGPSCFSSDYNSIYITKSMPASGKNKKNNFQLFTSNNIDGQWTTPTGFIHNNPDYSVGHPSLNKEGDILYFASDMPGGNGGSDIYYCTLTEGKWSDPINMGPEINTSGHEMFPVINYAGEECQLHFASNGHPGMGGMDIYSCVLNNTAQKKLKHYPFPVNSQADDFGLVFNNSDKEGFFSSNRYTDDGSDEILKFNSVEQKFFLKLSILNDETGEPVANAEMKLINGNTKTVEDLTADENGEVLLPISTNNDYKFIVKTNGYFSNKKTIHIPEMKRTKTINASLKLTEIVMEKAIVLDNIYYEYNKADITKEAIIELDKMVHLLKENPEISVEISAHTDCRGRSRYNENLSQKRAQSTVKYLIKKGIASKRLQGKGYGEKKLLNHCKDGEECSEEEHNQNRRTEFKVISLKN